MPKRKSNQPQEHWQRMADHGKLAMAESCLRNLATREKSFEQEANELADMIEDLDVRLRLHRGVKERSK